jgi:hypothetical protein
MADSTLTTAASILFEMQGAVQEQFATEHVYLAELNGVGSGGDVSRFTRDMDMQRDTFSGSQVRFPLVPYGLNGGGYVAEQGTWNVPHALDIDQATVTLKRTLVPFSITLDLQRDSQDNSAVQAQALHVKQARIHLAKIENIAALNAGGLVASVASATGSPGLTVPVTGVNWDIVLPGTVWDVLTRSNGANPGNGLRRLVASVTRTTSTTGDVVFDTASQASDGSSGNITFAATEGLYIPGSYGNCVQSLDDAAAVTGTFEGLNKATFAYWQGADGREGTTTELPLSDTILEQGVRVGRRWGTGRWNFGIGDPAAIDLYKQGKYAQVQYDKQSTTLKSGFKGVVFEGADQPFPLIKEPMHAKKSLRLIKRDTIQIYGDKVGPEFLADDGSMWRRFSRSLPIEADLLDRWQVAYKACNSIVFYNNLAQA